MMPIGSWSFTAFRISTWRWRSSSSSSIFPVSPLSSTRSSSPATVLRSVLRGQQSPELNGAGGDDARAQPTAAREPRLQAWAREERREVAARVARTHAGEARGAQGELAADQRVEVRAADDDVTPQRERLHADVARDRLVHERHLGVR